MPITHRDYLPLAEQNEGNIPWMYLDTAGHVTVGIGHMVESAADAEALGFVEPDPGRAATREGIRAAYAVVADARHLIGRPAGAFAALTLVRLPRAAVLAVYERDFDRIVGHTRDLFRAVGGGLDSYPDPAQMAVVDMAFNLGPTGLYTKFPKFRTEGLARRDFEVAARECRRSGIAERRNAETRNLLLEAARIEIRHRQNTLSGP